MKIQLKRSNQLEGGIAKEPSVAQMEYGELAVNYNTDDPSLFIKDSADNIVKLKIAEGAQVLISDTAPNPLITNVGTLWWNSSEDSGQLFILYDDPAGGGGGDTGGPKWIEASPNTGGGDGTGGAEVIVSPTAPVTDDLEEGSLWWNSDVSDLSMYVLYNDSGIKKWVDASPAANINADEFVAVTGDNMTGALTIGPEGGTAVTTLATDGSATFDGAVKSGVQIDAGGSGQLTPARFRRPTDGNTGFNISYADAASQDVILRNLSGNGKTQFTFNNSLSTELTVGIHNQDPTIRLSAQDGKADFAGLLTAGNPDADASGDKQYGFLNPTGIIGTYRDQTGHKYGSVRLNIGGTPGTSEDYQLNKQGHFSIAQINKDTTSNWNIQTDGSAEFAGTATFGQYDINEDEGEGTRIFPSGLVRAQRPLSKADPDPEVFVGYLGKDQTSRILASGQAEFTKDVLGRNFIASNALKTQFQGADRVVLGVNGSSFYKNTALDDEIIRIGNNGKADQIVLKGGGSADFSKTVTANRFNVGSITKTQPLVISSDGTELETSLVFFNNASTANNSNQSILFGYGSTGSAIARIDVQRFGGQRTGIFKLSTHVGGTNAERFRITETGIAKFFADVEVGDVNNRFKAIRGKTDGSSPTRCFIDGQVTNNTSKALSVRRWAAGNSPGSSTTVWSVDYAGTAAFSNAVFHLESDDPSNYTITTEEYTETETYVGPLGNVLEREVTKTREIDTYIGPTLDVKDRLQNLMSRLDSLESDEIADDATSTLLLTTVNNLNAQMAKVNLALTAIRTAANTAGTLDQLKSDIAAATADI